MLAVLPDAAVPLHSRQTGDAPGRRLRDRRGLAGWWLVRRSRGGDLRDVGSGQTGATNVGAGPRQPGFRAGPPARRGQRVGSGARRPRSHRPRRRGPLSRSPRVIAGHILPAWLGFRGGRGGGPLLGGCARSTRMLALGLGPRRARDRRAWPGTGSPPGPPRSARLLAAGGSNRAPPRSAYYLLLGGTGLVLLAHRAYFGKYFPALTPKPPASWSRARFSKSRRRRMSSSRSTGSTTRHSWRKFPSTPRPRGQARRQVPRREHLPDRRPRRPGHRHDGGPAPPALLPRLQAARPRPVAARPAAIRSSSGSSRSCRPTATARSPRPAAAFLQRGTAWTGATTWP